MNLRPITALALALCVVTCSDANTSPSPRFGRAQLALVPQFTERADAAAASGEASFDNVRITITRPPSAVLFDTTVDFVPGQEDLNLTLAVDAQAGEQLLATIQYRNATNVLYEGVATVIASLDHGGSGGQPTGVTVDYVGPGAAATKVVLSPDTAKLSTTSTLQLTATVTDDTGKVFADTPLGWSSSDETVATVSSSGLVTAQGKRGAARIIAATPTGITAAAALTFTPPATKIVVVSGDRQTGAAGSELPEKLVVEVEADDGGPVAGQTVAFRTSTGHITPDTAVTDDQGRASATMTLRHTVGVDVYFGQFGTAVAAASATSIAGEPVALAVIPATALPHAGAAVQLSAQLRDKFGNDAHVANRTVTWTGGAGGTFSSVTSQTDTAGIATTTFTVGPRPGATYSIAAASDTLSGTLSLMTAPPTAPARVLLLDPSTLKPLSALPSYTLLADGEGPAVAPVAQVVDSAGVPIPGAGLLISVLASGTTIIALPPIPTDTLGRLPLDTIDLGHAFDVPGSYTIRFSSADITTPTDVSVTIEAPALAKAAGDNQTGTVGEALAVQPAVVVTDPRGAPAAGLHVTFQVATGGGHLDPNVDVTTDANGKAVGGTWTLGNTVGAQTVVATLSSGASVTFSAVASPAVGAATKLAVVAPVPNAAVSGVAVGDPLRVQIQDENGNSVSGLTPTIAVSVSEGFALHGPTSAAADASTGAASFAGLRVIGSGNATLTFTADGLQPATVALAVSPAPAATLQLEGDASVTFDQGSTPNPLPRVRVTDSTGVGVPGTTVVFTALAGELPVFADTVLSGEAGYVDVPLSGISTVPPGVYVIIASATGLAGSPIRIEATVTSPGAGTLSLATQPATWTNDELAASAPQVQLVDAASHPVQGATIVANVTRVSGGGSLQLVDDHATTDAEGKATFAQLRVLGGVGTFTLTFSVGGSTIAPVTTGAINLVAGAATDIEASKALTVVQVLGPSQVESMNLPAVAVTDTSGNRVAGVAPQWGLSQPCILGITLGEAAASNADGVATAPAIGIPATTAGSCGIVARLTHGDHVDSVSFSLVLEPSGTLVYTANSTADPTAWSDPTNWSGMRTPGNADRVIINASVVAKAVPKLDLTNAEIGSLSMETGGLLDLNGNNLTIAGDLVGVSTSRDSAGEIYGTGTVTLTGATGSTVSGFIDEAHLVIGGTSCGGSYTLSYVIASSTTIRCPVQFADSSILYALGDFDTEGAGTVQIQSSESALVVGELTDVSPTATFNGGDESGLITDGFLYFGGNFVQTGTAKSFVASGNSLTIFAGSQPQQIRFDNPGARASRFGWLELANTAGVIGETNIFADSVDLYGSLTMNSNTTITATRASIEDGSAINGPGLAAFGGCYASGSATIAINSALGGLLSCELSDVVATGGGLGNRRPAGVTPLSAIPSLPRRTGSISARRQAACATLRQLNRLPAQLLRGVCRQ